ncbi:MAG: VWA domain-containing protein [Acidobacteria bacterium]|nr:VWA domain-containing protein [Acidobacteriota bacterium]
MTVTLAAPGALWLLLVVPIVWAALRFGRTNFNAKQRVLQAAVRSLLLALLVSALARPVVSTASSRQAIVYVVDVSHSIASRAIVEAAARIDALNAAAKPDAFRIVAFGSGTRVLDGTQALRAVASVDAAGEVDDIGRAGSDLERALSQARAELPPGHRARIVLFSDGHETSGDVHAAALRLAAEGVPVSVEPLEVRDLGDAWVDGIDVPDLVPAGGAAALTAIIGSQRDAADATIELRDAGRVLATARTALRAGSNEVPLGATFEAAGSHVVEVSLRVAGDPLAANNRLSREVLVQPRVKVLYVEGAPASATYLQGALDQGGFDVTVQPPSALPTGADALDAWDAVILSDVPRTAVPDAAMSALSAWVEREGGGVLVAGGESVFGENAESGPPGYRHTELERMLPVTFERKDEPDVALVIVLDKSWSMNGRVMELCKAAAQAAVDALTDRQTVGILTFDDRYAWDVTPRNVGQHRDEIRKAITAIQPGGDTLIYPAVEQAYLMLVKTKASAKHVVLLSDGRSYPDDYEGLVKKMVDAGITVSSIAVGPAADAALLSNIAKWGNGRPYVVQDASEVTQIFVKEARTAMSAFEEGEAIVPVVKARSVLSRVDLSDVPALRGRTAMVLKDTATEVLATRRDDPILAFWPFGLGRTAVFASDVKDRWAAAWVRWRGYGPFFSAVVRAVARQHLEPLSIELREGAVRNNARALGVAVEARDAAGRYRDLLQPVVHVQADDGAQVNVSARQVAPGRYEGTVIAIADRPLTISLAGMDPSTASPVRHIVPDLDAEYRLRPPDEALLRAVASATGGTFRPRAVDLTGQGRGDQRARRALWPVLVVTALGLWMADVWLRRIRLFEGRTA